MFAPRRTSLCICWSKLAEDDARVSLAEFFKQNLRQWEGHDRPRCMLCAPSSSTEENTTSSSSEGSLSNASATQHPVPLDWLLCMRCGLVCCGDHADIHNNQTEPAPSAVSDVSHACFFAFRTPHRPAIAYCRACSTTVAGSVVLPRLSDATRELLCDLESTYRMPLEGHMMQGLPNVLGHCSFMNAVLQCLKAAVASTAFGNHLATTVIEAPPTTTALQWFHVAFSRTITSTSNTRSLTESLHLSHRQMLGLDDEDCRGGEDDACDYWEFLLAVLDAELCQQMGRAPEVHPMRDLFEFVLPTTDSAVHHAYGLHLLLDAVDGGGPLSIVNLLTLNGLDSNLTFFRPDAFATLLLRRFAALPNNSVVKNRRQVSFPSDLTVSPTTRRRLLGVVAHRGSLPTGHHYAFVRDMIHQHRWILCDDLRAQWVSQELVLSEPCASILIYGPTEDISPTNSIAAA